MPDIGKFCVENEKNSSIFHHLKDYMKIFTSAGVKKNRKESGTILSQEGENYNFWTNIYPSSLQLWLLSTPMK